MADRKPLPKILQRDKAFTAKLEVSAEKRAAALVDHVPAPAPAVPVETKSEVAAPAPTPAPIKQRIAAPEPVADAPKDIEKAPAIVSVEPGLSRPRGRPRSGTPSDGTKTRLTVGVSLSPDAAMRAEAWAAKGKVPVGTLLRVIAARVSESIVEGWVSAGFPSEGDTVKHGRHTTTIYVAIPAEFGNAILAERDPLGLVGLARTIGPVYRDAFEVAFLKEADAAGF